MLFVPLFCAGAVSVLTGLGAVGSIQTNFARITFEGNINVAPGADPTTDLYDLSHGSCLSISQASIDVSTVDPTLLTAAEVHIQDCVFQRSTATSVSTIPCMRHGG